MAEAPPSSFPSGDQLVGCLQLGGRFAATDSSSIVVSPVPSACFSKMLKGTANGSPDGGPDEGRLEPIAMRVPSGDLSFAKTGPALRSGLGPGSGADDVTYTDC